MKTKIKELYYKWKVYHYMWWEIKKRTPLSRYDECWYWTWLYMCITSPHPVGFWITLIRILIVSYIVWNLTTHYRIKR